VLGDFRMFDRTFIVRDKWGNAQRYRNLNLLRDTMKQVMYRKSRSDVADQFPKVNSTVLPFYLSPAEATMYERVRDYAMDLLTEASSAYGTSFNLAAHYGADGDPRAEAMRGDIMSAVLLLRLICDDSRLVLESAAKFKKGDGNGSQLAAQLVDAGWFDHPPEVSTKREMFKEFLAGVLEEDSESKVVAFTTFKGLIRDIAADTSSITRHAILTGDMSARQRDDAMQVFKTDPKVRLFLSSDAGGYGVDLPNANHLVSLDLPWSTGSYEQREARIIRISSEWEQVWITMLLAQGSIDMRMQGMIEQKGGVATAFLDGRYDSKGGFSLNLGTLTEFLATAELRP
jgi:SNF2 family DNA or RNA helicase